VKRGIVADYCDVYICKKTLNPLNMVFLKELHDFTFWAAAVFPIVGMCDRNWVKGEFLEFG